MSASKSVTNDGAHARIVQKLAVQNVTVAENQLNRLPASQPVGPVEKLNHDRPTAEVYVQQVSGFDTRPMANESGAAPFRPEFRHVCTPVARSCKERTGVGCDRPSRGRSYTGRKPASALRFLSLRRPWCHLRARADTGV
jgi:hypothetical protein